MQQLVIIVGNLGKDPDLRTSAQGKPVCKFSVATSETWNGEKRTEWWNVVVFGAQASACAQYLKKGRLVYVEGRLQTQQYEDRNGDAKTAISLIANQVRFLGGNEASERREPVQEGPRRDTASRPTPAPQPRRGEFTPEPPDEEEEIPF